MNINNLEFGTLLYDIISIYKGGNEDPLDGDDVDKLVEHLRNQINLIQGNVTESEYYEIERMV